jgi:hypothetical protein
MPYIRQAGKTVRMAIRGLRAGRECVNIVHSLKATGGAITQAEAQAHSAVVMQSWQDDVLDNLPDDYTLQDMQVLSLDDTVSFSYLQAPIGGHPTVGTLSAASAPPQVAVLVHKVAVAAPRGFRPGRLYLAGIEEGNVDEAGMINPARLALIQTSMSAFFTQWTATVGGVEWVPVVPSWAGVTPDPIPPDPTPVLGLTVECGSLVVDGKVATQRRRLRG